MTNIRHQPEAGNSPLRIPEVRAPIPDLVCDLVMEGGVTSGVCYPKMIARLAEVYRFRNIGGTSAGAIATVAAGAAEYRRAAGSAAGFERLQRLPDELKAPGDRGRSMLLDLFQPVPALTRHFQVITAMLNAGSKRKLLLKGYLSLLRHFPPGAFVGALPAVLMLYVSVDHAVALSAGALFFVLLLLLLGAGAGALATALLSLARALPKSSFGLCSGMTEGTLDAHRPGLVPWLHSYVQDIANKSEPVTFGDLAGIAADRGGPIHVQMMTTAINLGRPFRVPIEDFHFFFRRDEWESLFPSPIMQWLVDHPSVDAVKRPEIRAFAEANQLIALPAPDDWPIVLAARLSFSFPLLLAAIPLWHIEHGDDNPITKRRCWFSDGGITSNMPIHFFDSPLPVHPTFGVTLVAGLPEDSTDDTLRAHLPLTNAEGLELPFAAIPQDGLVKPLAAFVKTTLGAAMNWRDTLQRISPGYRDRVVEIRHKASEGGLNLDMLPDQIDKLAESGKRAADLIIAGFAQPADAAADRWLNHRWVRVRSTLSVLETLASNVAAGIGAPGKPSIDELIDRPKGSVPVAYPLSSQAQRDSARTILHAIAQCAPATSPGPLAKGAPKPAVELRIVPKT